jgi:hypothetical protein
MLTCSRSFAAQRMDHRAVSMPAVAGAHGSDNGHTTDGSADADHSRAHAVLASRTRGQLRVQRLRVARRGGAAPLPRTHRHLSKPEQYEIDVSPASILMAMGV